MRKVVGDSYVSRIIKFNTFNTFNNVEVKRYYVSAERGQRVDRFWFRTEEEARDKFTDLLAARGADWDIRMRRLDDADLERERRIFGAS